ncbi:MAG: protein kinase [Cyanobacteriota bacterium]|nr:protein kinase [Cyanobacteriota bacterium]
MAPRQRDPWVNKTIGQGGRYVLEALLGAGSAGRVYKALDRKLSEKTLPIYKAIKILDYNLGTKRTLRERFQREMQACMSIQDSRIVQVVDFGVVSIKAGSEETIEVPFMVMEFIIGKTLEQHLQEKSHFDVPTMVHLSRQMAAAVQAVHAGSIIQGQAVRFIHRDIKPANMFLIKDAMGSETIKLGDFGLVKFLSDGDIGEITKTGKFGGTPAYASPEQFQGLKSVDGRSDIYSLGCVFYEMLTGVNPFRLTRQASLSQWMQAHTQQNPQPFPPELGIPKGLEMIVFRCLEKSPNSRFSTARELEAALKQVEQSLPAVVPTLASPPAIPALATPELTEAQIGQLLVDHLSPYQIRPQAAWQEKTLNILLERLTHRPIAYEAMTNELTQYVRSLQISGIEYLHLTSRQRGSEEIDWSQDVELSLFQVIEDIPDSPLFNHQQPFGVALGGQEEQAVKVVETASLVEAEIIEFLEESLFKYNLRLQLLQEGKALNIMLNRLTDEPLDFEKVSLDVAYEIQAFRLTDIDTLIIFSRPFGTDLPDWKIQIDLRQSPIRLPAPAAVPSPVQPPSRPTPVVAPPPAALDPSLELTVPPLTASADPFLMPTVPQIPLHEMIKPVPHRLSDPPQPISMVPPTQPVESLHPTAHSVLFSDEELAHLDAQEDFFNLPEESAEPELEVLPELDLTSYCFIKNMMLIRTTLPPPPADVAQSLLFFHELSDTNKFRVLPSLVKIFNENQAPVLDGMLPFLRDWLQSVQNLDSQKFKTFAIWLSRYCADPPKAISEISAGLIPVVEAKLSNPPEAKTSGPASVKVGADPVLYQAKPHWLALSAPILLSIYLVLATVVIFPSPLSGSLLSLIGLDNLVLSIVFRIMVAASMVWVLRVLLKHKKSTVSLTRTKLIIIEHYLFEEASTEINLESLTSISVRPHWLGNILGYGSVIVAGHGFSVDPIDRMPNAAQIKNQIDFLRQQLVLNRQLEKMPAKEAVGNKPMISKPKEGKDSWAGVTLGEGRRYRLDSLLGRGGMGIVYKALDQKLSLTVAIKFMSTTGAADQSDRQRFQREMQACLNLQDNRIVRVLDFGIASEEGMGMDALPYLVMEYVSSPTLEQVLRKHSRLPMDRAVNIAANICSALQAVHTGVILHGKRVPLIHRDLKPSNIFLLKDAVGSETIKLADFGLVKFQGEASIESLSMTGDFRGTPNYAAPEQCEGHKNIDRRADIYSLGCLMYEMLSGTNAFGLNSKATVMQWLYAHVQTKPRAFTPSLGIPKPLERIVLQCLEKDPAARFSNVVEIKAALEQLKLSG